MFFDKEDIESEIGCKDTVNADKFMDRVANAIKSKFVFVPDYQCQEKVRLDEAEDFLMKLYRILKEE